MCGGNGLLYLDVRLGIEACKSSQQGQEKEAANEMKEKRRPFTENDFVHALRFRDKTAHELLMLELASIGRLGGLVMSFQGLHQLEPQVLPILPKGLDFTQPLLLRFPQPFHFLCQPDNFKAALFGYLGRRLEIDHRKRMSRILLLQLLLEHGQRDDNG